MYYNQAPQQMFNHQIQLETSSDDDDDDSNRHDRQIREQFHAQQHQQYHLAPATHQNGTYPLYYNTGLYSNEQLQKPMTTTLYQNRSVSIINCEYKLKEKYPHLVTLIFFFIIYITMILLGASLFMAFEAKAEQRLRDQILNKQQMFIEQNPCLDPKELKQFIKSIIITYDKGVNLALLNDLIEAMTPSNPSRLKTPTLIEDESTIVKKIQENTPTNQSVSKTILIDKTLDGDVDNVVEEIIVTSRKDNQEGAKVLRSSFIVPNQMLNWEFGSSMTYVASVVTTIGYGHVTPITNEGKILTIVFGMVSIPCTLLFLSIIISMIRDGPIKQIEVWLIKLFGYFTEEVTLLKIRFLHLFLVTSVLFSLLIILPAFLFQKMEQWTFLESFYYCFITITTVGLGDYVPGQNGLSENRTWYLISIVLYMYTGLCMMMLWIALVLRIPYFNFKTFLVIEEPELLERKILMESSNMMNNDHQMDNEKTPLISPTTSISMQASTSSGSLSTTNHHSQQKQQQQQTQADHNRTYQNIYGR